MIGILKILAILQTCRTELRVVVVFLGKLTLCQSRVRLELIELLKLLDRKLGSHAEVCVGILDVSFAIDDILVLVGLDGKLVERCGVARIILGFHVALQHEHGALGVFRVLEGLVEILVDLLVVSDRVNVVISTGNRCHKGGVFLVGLHALLEEIFGSTLLALLESHLAQTDIVHTVGGIGSHALVKIGFGRVEIIALKVDRAEIVVAY